MVLLGFVAVLAAGRGWWAQIAGVGDPRPLVVASTTILADLASQVGGPRVRVHSLLAPGQDPHSYEPVPRDALAMHRARLVLLNGYGLDLWAERLLEGLPEAGDPGPAGDGVPGTGPRPSHPPGHPDRPPLPLVVRVAESADTEPLPWPGDGSRADPHLWMDPVRVMGYVDVIRDALIQIDPAGAAFYRRQADRYKAALAELDGWIARQVAAVPPERRLLVTTHDAYRYFGRRYGLRVVDTVWGISTEEEPSAADLARLMGHLRRYGVPAFVESTINPKLMEELAAQAGVSIGGRLYADSVGPPGSGAETYLGMMRHNVRVITAALGASG
ncbi:MAG TPA: zinc ABC transporter substrate-binding protein [Thermaerobacter sp.]